MFTEILNNSSEDVRANITIRVRESAAGMVVTAVVNAVPLRRGRNTLDRNSFSRGRFSFGNNNYGSTASQSGKFPEGEYEYCFEVEITESKTTWTNPYFENCFVLQLSPLTPLLLINPADGDESCNTRPAFLWQPPFPLPAGARCRLVLTELGEKQDLAEAINYNLPLINQGNITGNQLMYPGGVPSLVEGKKYVWQVTVYAGNAILKKSEIWEYVVACQQEKNESVSDSYRELKESPDGNFYIADKVLRFSFYNPYGAGVVAYSIVNVSNSEISIKKLPELRMQPGLNKYEIDLSENKLFKNGDEYLLKVFLPGNRELQLRFIYINE